MNKLIAGLAVACLAIAAVFLTPSISRGEQTATLPASIAAPDGVRVLTVHAEGAQLYECKRNDAGALVWHFREPVASLWLDGKTVGRHYAGPTWELTDGSAITAKVAGRAAGQSPQDIPLLKLAVTGQRDIGKLAGVSVIQRINTQGGVLEGACQSQGDAKSVPYAADYVFLSGNQQF